MIASRVLAFVVGVALTAAMAHSNIAAAGGYGTPLSFVVLAMAAGIVIGSIVIGHSLSQRRYVLAVFLAVGMLAGEAYNFLSSADRVILAAEGAQAPLKDALLRHQRAIIDLTEAKAMKPRAASKDRLVSAEKAKSEADTAAREQASLPGCRTNCASLLQSAIDRASREVDAARTELAEHDRLESQHIAGKVAEAERELAAAPSPPSATPFADRIGWSPSDLDLLKAFCFAVALNGLAAGLIAYAAHGTQPTTSHPTNLPASTVAELDHPTRTLMSGARRIKKSGASIPLRLPPKSAHFDVLGFGADHLQPAPGDTLDFDDFFNAYAATAKANELRAYGPTEFVGPFKRLCDEAGINVRRKGQRVFLCDVKLAG